MYSGSTTGLPKISPLLLDGAIFESVIFESVKYVANLAMEPLFRKSILTVLIHDAKRFEGLNAQLRLGGSAEIFHNRSVQQKKCKNFINTGILYCFKEQVNPTILLPLLLVFCFLRFATLLTRSNVQRFMRMSVR